MTLGVLTAFVAVGFAGLLSGGEPPDSAGWQRLFDGSELGRWKVIDRFDFQRHGKVYVDDSAIVMEAGSPATGVRWTGEFPRNNYEVSLEGKRVAGDDFFCSMTFPVGEKALTLVVGGWNGEIVGLSSINDEPAVENETCQYVEFENGRWYHVRLKVSVPKVEAWIDDEKLIDLERKDRKFSLYWEMEPMLPFGIATWRTTGSVRNIRLKTLATAAPSPEADQADR